MQLRYAARFAPLGAKRRPISFPIAALIGIAAAVGGCAGTRPDPEAEKAASIASGIADAVVFRTEGGPLDEPERSESEASRLTLGEAVRLAVTTDPGLQAALARVRIAMADADQARLLPNPVLNIVLRFDVSGGGKPQIEASLAQDLIGILRLPRQSSAADHRLRQSAAESVTVALEVVSEVQERYAEAQAFDRLAPVLNERHGLIDKLLGVMRSRLSAGEGIRSDVTTLDTQRVELEVELADTQLKQREARLRLARLIGEPSRGAAWTLDPWESPAASELPESQWIDAALQHRPEVQAIAWQLAALGDNAALARLLPWDGASAGVSAQRDPDWALGPAISTPLAVFDMGQAKRARITAEQIEARHNLTLAKRKIVEDVRVAYENVIGSQANLRRIREELIPLQQRRRQEAESLYRAGQTDVTSLFLAEQDLRSVQVRAVQIERQATTAQIRLQRAVGGPGVAASFSSASVHPTRAPMK